jgi:hypothetical protein
MELFGPLAVLVLLGLSSCAYELALPDTDTRTADSETSSATFETESETSSATVETDSETTSEPQETRLFYESFESPKKPSCDGIEMPTGWVLRDGNPNYVSLDREDCGQFSTPDGEQALRIYTNIIFGSTSMTTTSGLFKETLAPNTTYALTCNVARISNGTPTNYSMELLAINDVTEVPTVLESAIGTVDSSDMSRAAFLEFTTGDSHANLGQRIAIRVLKKDNGVSWFDSVRLTATLHQ